VPVLNADFFRDAVGARDLLQWAFRKRIEAHRIIGWVRSVPFRRPA
jgi:hypothetical protein